MNFWQFDQCPSVISQHNLWAAGALYKSINQFEIQEHANELLDRLFQSPGYSQDPDNSWTVLQQSN